MKRGAFSLVELSIVLIIVGIITASITAAPLLIGNYRINNARTLTQNSAVNSIPDLFLWLDATAFDAFNITNINDGDSITTWKDQNKRTTIKNDATQSTSSYRPTYVTNAINNLPIVRFDGTDDYLYVNSLEMSQLSDSNQITIFFAIKNTSNNATQVLFSIEDNSPNNRIGCEINSNIPRFDFPNDVSGKLIAASNIYNQNTILTLHKTAQNQTIYINGTSDATQANALSITPYNNSLRIASYGNNYFTGADIGEIIVFSRGLTSKERSQVEQYLGKKWGIDISS